MFGLRSIQPIAIAGIIAILIFAYFWQVERTNSTLLKSELSHELIKGKKPPYRNQIGTFKKGFVEKKLKELKGLDTVDEVFLPPDDLPVGTAQLRINDSHLLRHLFPGTAFKVSWDFTYRADSSGIYLISALTEEELVCNSNLTDSPSLVGNGFYFHNAPTGDHKGFTMLSPLFLPLWKTIYFAGCVTQDDGAGVFTYLGDRTNIVAVDYTHAPDLVVTDIFWETDGDIEFIVKNEGFWKKNLGLIRYHIRMDTYDDFGEIEGTSNFFGDAALTSISVLYPTESTGWDRAVDHVILPGESKSITVCINPGRSFVETNFNNNCLVKLPEDLLPDLTIEDDVALFLGEPEQEDDGFWLWEPFKMIWELITTPGLEFDVSGLASDHLTFTITNSGNITMIRYEVGFSVWSGLNPSESTSENIFTIEESLNPGESKKLFLYFDTNQFRYDDPTQVFGSVVFDPSNKLAESDDSNNKKSLSSVQRK